MAEFGPWRSVSNGPTPPATQSMPPTDRTGVPMTLTPPGLPPAQPGSTVAPVGTLGEDTIAGIDDETGEVVLVIHCKGGRHMELRVMKPMPDEHGAKTGQQALSVVRDVVGRRSDDAIVACLNRQGMPTGQSKTRLLDPPGQ